MRLTGIEGPNRTTSTVGDFGQSVILAIAAPLASALGSAIVDALNHDRAERSQSRARWEALIDAERKEARMPRCAPAIDRE